MKDTEEQVEATDGYGEDVHIVERDGREFIVVGTAHISRRSAELVRTVIEKEKPECVCVELDERRFKALNERDKWLKLDLKGVIRQKQLSTLIINLVMASYQKKLGDQLGVEPGTELLEATRTAKEMGTPVALCDRDIRITLRRAWQSMSLWDKMKFFFSGTGDLFDKQEVSEETLAQLRQKDVLSELMEDLGRAMPVVKTILLDERDIYLAQKIQETAGQRLVAVVGAGHVQGILEALRQGRQQDLSELEQIPPISPVWQWIGWGIPALILGSIAYIGWSKGLMAAEENAIYWFLANGIPAALGALLALGHPLTILAAFVAAPFTSLTPVIGAGYVAAFVQVYYASPLVADVQRVVDDAGRSRNWWRNRLLRVLLVFVFTSLGSLIGTYVGAYEVISNLF